jgi:predicted porin
MAKFKPIGLLVVLLAALLVVGVWPSRSIAAQDQTNEQIRALQQRLDELSKQIDELRKQQAAAAKAAPAAPAAPAAAAGPPKKEAPPAEPAFDKFMKGFFGTLDVSVDYTTKGMSDEQAFHWGYAPGVVPAPGLGPSAYVNNGPKVGPIGRVGWLGAMSTNGSNIGYRGTHKIGTSDVDFIYQVSTAFSVDAAPGLQNTWTKQSNTVMGAIGLGDTFIGFQKKGWGRLRFGEMYMPYKTATDRLNPFAGELGNYSVVMGNSGGDNRIEFGTRIDHVVTYSSPDLSGFSFDVAYGFGQQITRDNTTSPLGSPDCSGANVAGSGNLLLNCDDGAWDDSYSVDFKFERGGLYLVGAYEMHKRVNRNSDGIGSNDPYYGYLAGLGSGNALSASILDWGTYCTLVGSQDPGNCPGAAPGTAGLGVAPGFFADGGSPPYLNDIADEWAAKIGIQYRFDFGLTVNAMWEEMHRNLPAILMWQNERQRTGDWLALSQEFNGGADLISIGWAHAGATVGDPGGQHNFDPTKSGQDQANMYTISWHHKLDKQLTWYLDAAETVNDGNVHYDIGAGGHGIKTDCHDGTHNMVIDYSSFGPTTWGGCHEIGVSTGVNFKF